MRRKVQTENIHSLAFRDIREGVTLRRLIVRSFECTVYMLFSKHISYIALILTAAMTSDSIWAWRWTLIVTPLVES